LSEEASDSDSTPISSSFSSTNEEVEVLFENPRLLVVFKPRGLMVHANIHEPGAPTLENILSGRFHQKIHGVHRLDRGTSGLMVYAKDKETCGQLSEQFAQRQVSKVYKAILTREITETEEVDSPLRNKPKHRAVPARTTINPLRCSPGLTLEGYDGEVIFTEAALTLHTGRNHQARKHSRKIGAPILGDNQYGFTGLNRAWQMAGHSKGFYLLAWKLEFQDPGTGEAFSFTAEEPKYYQEAIEKLFFPRNSSAEFKLQPN
jgi:23S rRNA-/tRNA-specific pseudouridylate synthase